MLANDRNRARSVTACSSSRPSSINTKPGRRGDGASSSKGSANGSRGGTAASSGSRAPASADNTTRPEAARNASAMRRLARAAKIEPPHTNGAASANSIAMALAGLWLMSTSGADSSATRSIASAT